MLPQLMEVVRVPAADAPRATHKATPTAPASVVAAAGQCSRRRPWRRRPRSGLDRRLDAATVDRRSGCPGRLDAATVVARRCPSRFSALCRRHPALLATFAGTNPGGDRVRRADRDRDLLLGDGRRLHRSPEPVSSYSTDPTTTVADLAVGDCFDDGNAEGVVRLPCTIAHDGEIIGIVTLREGPYPGDNAVDKAADRACTHEFTKYVGKSVDDSELDLYYWPPNEDQWNDDDRVVVCDATYRGDAYAKLTGTIKNSHR